jgi:hypothetical protein
VYGAVVIGGTATEISGTDGAVVLVAVSPVENPAHGPSPGMRSNCAKFETTGLVGETFRGASKILQKRNNQHRWTTAALTMS